MPNWCRWDSIYCLKSGGVDQGLEVCRNGTCWKKKGKNLCQNSGDEAGNGGRKIRGDRIMKQVIILGRTPVSASSGVLHNELVSFSYTNLL